MTGRAINVDKLTNEQLEKAVESLSGKITSEVDATCDRINKLLSRYGLKCKMQAVFEELAESDQTEARDKIS